MKTKTLLACGAIADSLSGVGRAGGSYPMETFTEPKTITMNLG